MFPGFTMLSARALQFVCFSLGGHVRSYEETTSTGAPAMSFTFASPTQVIYSGANLKQLDVPTTTGMFGILSSHVPTLQVLRPELVAVFAEDGSASKYFVSSGSVTGNVDSSVQLLAEEAVQLDILGPSTEKSNLEKTQEELKSAGDEVAKEEVQVNVKACKAVVKALG